MNTTGIIIQARMGSQRLPGKSLRLLHGRPMIHYVIDRVQRVKNIDIVILATSSDTADDPLADYVAAQENIELFRGSLDDVQQRFRDAAAQYELDLIVRVTGDNPLISPELIQHMCVARENNPVDYIGYRKCILGIGAELFTHNAFKRACTLMDTPYAHEHVTPALYQLPQHFSTLFLDAPSVYSDNRLRFTVDTDDDFKFMETVYAAYAEEGYVSLNTVLANRVQLQRR